MNDFLIILLTSFITSAIILTALYFFQKKMEQQTDKQVKSAERIEDTGSSFNKQISNLTLSVNNQLGELRELQNDLQKEQRETSKTFDRFIAMTTLKPTAKGRMGEGLVRWALGILPDNWWEEQVSIDGGIVDFSVKLTDEDELYIDSKFSLSDNFMEDDHTAFLDQDTVKKINRTAVKRSKELHKYNRKNPKSVGFVLMFIPSVMYSNLSTDSINEMYSNRIIPVDVSGLLSTVFLVQRIIRLFKLGQAQEHLLRIREVVPRDLDELKASHEIAEKHLKNANKKMKVVRESIVEIKSNFLQLFEQVEKET